MVINNTIQTALLVTVLLYMYTKDWGVGGGGDYKMKSARVEMYFKFLNCLIITKGTTMQLTMYFIFYKLETIFLLSFLSVSVSLLE
jgi:hypothetical protein